LKTFSAVFFDLDGLLADTEPLHIAAYKAVEDYLGIAFDEQYVVSFFGGGTRDNIRRLGIPENIFEDVLKIRYNAYYDIIVHSRLEPMEGALECIEKFKKERLKLGLVTSSIKEHAVAVLGNISKNAGNGKNLASSFDVMVFGDEIERLKPEPDIYLEAVKRIGLAADRCIALEDSEVGVIAAKKAGIFVIAIPNELTKNQSFGMADMMADSLRELCAGSVL